MNEPTLYQEPKDCQHRRAKLGIPPTCVECEAKMHWVVPVKMDIDEIVHELADCVLHGSWGTGCDFDYAEARAIILRIGDTDDEG